VLVVAAAGNDGTSNDDTPHYPSSFDLDNIIAVAAIDRVGRLATFSNYGAGSVHVGAPGDEIFSAFNASDSAYATAAARVWPRTCLGGGGLVRAKFPESR